MPYKIHIDSGEVVESQPLETVDTLDDAKASLQALVSRGIINVYAVGYDWPPTDRQ